MSSSARKCRFFAVFCAWLVKVTMTLKRWFQPVSPELPLSNVDLHIRRPFNNSGVFDDAAEKEQLVRSSHWQRELKLPRLRDICEYKVFNQVSERGHNFQVVSDGTGASVTLSPTPSHSPSLLPPPTPSLLYLPSTLHSPTVCPSLLDTEDGSCTSDIDSDACSGLESDQAGGLGKRRGFKGSPLVTPKTEKKVNMSFLSALSPKLPPFTPRPSTPRSPLATVTNLMRTSTPKPIKSPAMKVDLPVSDELQECYEMADPFAVMGDSFFTLEAVSAHIPFPALERFEVYKAPELIPVPTLAPRFKTFRKDVNKSAAHRKPKGVETNIYDTMVYNFRPKMQKVGKKRNRKPTATAGSCGPRHVVLGRRGATTMDVLMELKGDPRVHLPCESQRDSVILTERHLEKWPVPLDFSCTSEAGFLPDSQEVVVNLRAAIVPCTVPCTPVTRDVDGSPPLADATVPANRRQSKALDDLLALLDVCVHELAKDGNTEFPMEQTAGPWRGAVAV
ncbi:hypothetical protein B0H10DRAFT_2427861 [Mycena sp. CBHHK59/15]|nr:hypothetical protein B0H10DRAFT_2427861 [Mycena sp. CBHHK59/15]